MNIQTFSAMITQSDNKLILLLPFNPNVVWGEKQRHHIAGSINGHKVRGSVGIFENQHYLPLGATWCQDNALGAGTIVEAELMPEGPQMEQLDPDLLSALEDEPQAFAFFMSLATFYRKEYLKWIDGAKRRPEVRTERIQGLIELLKAGKKQR